jgi:superfamily II DNA or RNA helicase
MFLYIQTNNDWNYENKFKYGITQNPLERINSDQHSYKTFYKSIYEYNITEKYILNFKQVDKIISIIGRNINYINKLKNKYNYDFIYLNEINKYLVNNDGGIEFIYNNGLEILEKILLIEFNILGIEIKKFNIDDLQKINNNIKSYNDNCDFKLEFIDNQLHVHHHGSLDHKYNLRDYQIKIFNKSIELIVENNKLYLELATGAGKSLIAYNIIDYFNPKIVIILTPRINICEQNISDKYKQILNNKDCIILCFCIQSYKKVYEIIKSEKYSDIFIWFDEAHWALDGWIENNCNNNYIKDFFLIDQEYIKYRLFTTASPDKNFINRYKNIYGELYNPIKVSELMKEKWLCNIQVHIYKEKYNDINNISFINFIFNKFKELNKKLGMNFNKDCDTATERFMIHYKLYNDNKTDIKPFLLLNDEYIDKLSIDIDKDFIDTDFTDINIFNDYNNAIGYVVAKYSMGYDNKNIDLLIFNDPKLSYQDIIQSIGRGTRPDQEAEEGKNKNKINDIILPVNINELDDANTFNKIKEILKYLLIDLELEPEQIFNFINNKIKTNKSYVDNKDDDDEIKIIESMIYNIYTNNYNWTLSKLTKQLLNNNIHNYKDYQKYKNDNEYLNLPEELFRNFPKFDFYNTYKLNECPYYTKEECIKTIEKYQRDLIDIDDDDDKIIFLNNKDNKIPNECLWYFYGGTSKDYLIF